ncbi:CFEM domain-containing protein [Colletotrichum karsti]|uniref:CFEM domain-containing protein n=1 Tax=Colletotrichum karsti TaxID=1095194 RepID=A0A9P6LGG6_9PEZI|nr:CFEM domain-containing protein [Colletotrichum karsti]KAF9872518.1 CFEM domain-containing protein [Colletotrichum karsti]
MAIKATRVSTWGADDTFILIAYVSEVLYVSGENGAGRDMWKLTPNQITNYFMSVYIGQVLYTFTICLVKASILFMYLRIFPGETFRAVLWGTQAFNAAVGISVTIVGVFQCHPIHLAWTVWRQDGQSQGWCMNYILIGVIHGGVQVALDVWMLILPASQVLGLNMRWKKKCAVFFMFSLGIFLTAASAVRFGFLLKYQEGTHNFTTDSYPLAVWSNIELSVAVFTACIPSIRKFLVRFVFKSLGETTNVQLDQGQDRSSRSTSKRSIRHAADSVEDSSPRL